MIIKQHVLNLRYPKPCKLVQRFRSGQNLGTSNHNCPRGNFDPPPSLYKTPATDVPSWKIPNVRTKHLLNQHT